MTLPETVLTSNPKNRRFFMCTSQLKYIILSFFFVDKS